MSACLFFFFFNDTATTEIYTLSLHDALPISSWDRSSRHCSLLAAPARGFSDRRPSCPSRQAARLPSRSEEHTSEPSHSSISYAVFCLKKKNKKSTIQSSSLLYTVPF